MATYGQLISFGPRFSGGLLCTLKVYHYVVGTTTLKDVYLDREKGSTAAQPAVSDANGIVYFYADGLYKFRIDGATDGATYTTLDTIDKWAVADQSALVGEGAAIASATTLTLGTDGNIFHVTGSTGPIGAISGNQSEVTLIFDSTPTLTHSGNLILQHAIDFTAFAGATMVLVNDGAGVWREISRTPTFEIISAKGDLLVGTANNAVSRLAVGSAGGVLMARTAETTGLAYVFPFLKHIAGLNWLPDTLDAVNDIQINPGVAMDGGGTYMMRYASSIVKQSDAVWAVGENQGALDLIGSAGNNDFYIWMIARSDTGVVDFLFSLSSTAPTMPASYDFKRLIGWFKRAGGTIVAFSTYETAGGGVELQWDVPTLDINLANTLTTSRRTDAVKVPLNFSTIAHLNVVLSDASANGRAWIYCPNQTDTAPSDTAGPLANMTSVTTASVGASQLHIRTSATGTIAARGLITFDLYAASTIGFTWARR